MSWNYRRVVYTYKVETICAITPYRLFGITEVYYNDKGIPDSYVDCCEMGLLTSHEGIEELKGEYNLIADAFNKPILDLDNFPNEYTV